MSSPQLTGLLRRALRTRSRAGLASLLVVALVALGTWWFTERGGEETAGGTQPVACEAPAALACVAVADLPREARDTLALIDAGGPFPYPEHDDQTFHNNEGLLPDEPDGYYREYTVETPGLSHRGPLRIVTGDGGESYWTDDHYESFSVIQR